MLTTASRFAPSFPFSALMSAPTEKRVEFPDTRWRILVVCQPSCHTCAQTLRSMGELSRQYPGAVLVAAAREHRDAAAASLKELAFAGDTLIVQEGALPPGDTSPEIPFLIAPDGKYIRSSLLRWAELAKAFVSLPPSPARGPGKDNH